MYDIVPVKVVEHLENGEYREAMLPVAMFFDSVPVAVEHTDKGDVAIFTVISYGVDEDGKEDTKSMRAVYGGVLYGTAGYDASNNDDGKARLVVDGENSVSLFDNKKYVYFELDASLESVTQLKFFDSNGALYLSIDGIELNFDEQFFADVAPLIEQYNTDFTQTEKLDGLRNELLKNPNYAQSSDKEAKKIADTRSAIIIVAYFVCVYIVADFLLGNHYIIRFFRWFIYDVCKAKRKGKQVKPNKEIFGHDYYCQVTVSLDLDALPDFNESVQVKYTNSDVELVFILLKENNYTATERVKAGVYVNPFIDMNREYAPVDLPDNLEVEGFKMETKIKIIRREV